MNPKFGSGSHRGDRHKSSSPRSRRSSHQDSKDSGGKKDFEFKKGEKPSKPSYPQKDHIFFEIPAEARDWPQPWAKLKSVAFHPYIYDRMVDGVSPQIQAGSILSVYDRNGERFGSAFYNPHSRIRLRMLSFDDQPIDANFYRNLIRRAVKLREDTLDLSDSTNCYRLFHSEGDGLSGLIVDRYDTTLSIEVFSLGVWKNLDQIVPILLEESGASTYRVHVDFLTAQRENMERELKANPPPSTASKSIRVLENGLRFAIDFEAGHKTGFFCDQRDNRKKLAEWVQGRDLLDLCCYTGGFSITAKANGAKEVIGVDLDEKAIAQAKHNANLNQQRIKWVHSDAFIYARQMIDNGRKWNALVLDPPKFIGSRSGFDEGRKKYFDLNRLALSLMEPGGLFVTCSCSGLLNSYDFEKLVVDAAHNIRRSLQWLGSTGAGPDHPVASNCPEGRYLKVAWWRVVD